ncbi:hypothetical protein QBC32DRAFT_233630 [Pseudoneurospora amorphoporcata]|uniref:Velvet domain-containing protein n=1 Tax=Pseudoneurospora amorphoporcata TaxID=241081 RepID=A0AAN6NXF6_9PEZI|nr:hypothetical protein QBC32DRAFT_233630 [Pseudoneurospora amorphoporcata]
MSSSVSSKYSTTPHTYRMSTSTGSTLNDIPISVVVKPPPHILTGNNVKIPAVIKYGPMPTDQAPSEVHGMLYLVDATTNQQVNDDRAAQSLHGLAKTAVAEQDGEHTSFFLLFHDATFPKSGRYRIAVSLFEPHMDIDDDGMPVLATRKLGDVQTDVVNVGQVGGDETHTAEEQGVINMLARMGVAGAR